MHTSSMWIIGVELSSRIGSEEVAIHCSCSATIVVMTLTTPLYKLGVKRILNFRYSNILQINEQINELFFKNFLYN